MIRDFVAALQFLTGAPLPCPTNEKNFNRSLAYYPLAGALIGAATGFLNTWAGSWMPLPLAAALTISFYLALTRGLHLDGFMDTLDAFLSRKSRQTQLEIMKQSTVGAFAVMGAGCWFLLLFCAWPFISVPESIVIQTCSRLGILLTPLIVPYARDTGTAHLFWKSARFAILLPALFLAAALIFLLDPRGLILIPLAFLVSIAVGCWSKRRIGGMTGDGLGFTIESTHLLFMASAAILKYNKLI